jgi:hypothetical protein
MLGLLTLGLTIVMIFKLVKNALIGKQLTSDAHFPGSIELIIPITSQSYIHVEPWLASLKNFKVLQGRLKIHVLVDGHHPSLTTWQEIHQQFPFIEIQNFLMRPQDTDAIPWMIEQVAPRIQGQIVILGDADIVPSEAAFLSLAKYVSEKNKSFFVLPQTAKVSAMGEAIAVLNPTLTLASVFGFRKIRRNISHPLMSISHGWMGMTLDAFKELNFHHVHVTGWKEAVLKQWDRDEKDFILAFGEKYLRRYYPEDLKEHLHSMKDYWSDLWNNYSKSSFWLFVASLFIWSFPILFFYSKFFWAIASFLLLTMYRFFSKIVFQESWTSIVLHPVGCLAWIGTLFWWLGSDLKTKFSSQGPLKS